ncbi:MAG: threonine/serine exporter family protein [Oscillospiraceae bacterium]|nr:threonine/serine exporter family protein [Oscillospiraceae bacterium]
MTTEEAVQTALETPDALLAYILDMGELLLTNGAEVLRVEDTLTRLCTAYGLSHVNVFSITSSIVLTVQCSDGRVITQTRRISTRGTNLHKVAMVNALSRQLCRAPEPVEVLSPKISKIRESKTYPLPVQCLSYALISAVFSVFFGGTAWDGFAAALSGIMVFCTQYFIQKLRMNGILQSMLVSAFTALAVVMLVRMGIGHTPEKITIGNIMLLIPGIAFTTSLRDIINGDTISGLVGISEAVIKSVAIAIGFAAVLVQMGGAL